MEWGDSVYFQCQNFPSFISSNIDRINESPFVMLVVRIANFLLLENMFVCKKRNAEISTDVTPPIKTISVVRGSKLTFSKYSTNDEEGFGFLPEINTACC